MDIYSKTSSEIMQDIFPIKERGNLRNQAEFLISLVKGINYGIESMRVLRSKMRMSFPYFIKNKELFDSFKTAIKKWKPDSCPCRILKLYIYENKH